MFFEFSLDWEQELARLLDAYTIFIPSSVQKELSMLSTQREGRLKRKALAALKLINNYNTIDTISDNADDAVLEAAKETQGVVVTNDTELRKRLKQESVPTIFLRGKKKLAIDE